MIMRKIKFRAWDKKTKKLFDDITHSMGIMPLNEMLEKEGRLPINFYSVCNEERFVVTQYSKFTDCKKKQICAGDILKCEVGRNEIVEFKKGMFLCRYRDIPLYELWLNQEIEIIGNIYEKAS